MGDHDHYVNEDNYIDKVGAAMTGDTATARVVRMVEVFMMKGAMNRWYVLCWWRYRCSEDEVHKFVSLHVACH